MKKGILFFVFICLFLFNLEIVQAVYKGKVSKKENIHQEEEVVPGEFLVRLKKPNFHFMKSSNSNLSRLLKSQVIRRIDEYDILIVKRPSIENKSLSQEFLMKNDFVESVEPNIRYHIQKTPNDLDFGKLWGLKNVGQVDTENQLGIAGVDIGAEEAWDITTGSKDVIVAVIDTGVDYTHPDLKENIWINKREFEGTLGIDDDGNGVVDDIYGASFTKGLPTGDPMDTHGHGSHTSGTIGAVGNNQANIVGVNWAVSIMAVQFIDSEGSGTLEDAIRAIDYSVKMGAKIISASWGGTTSSENLKLAIQKAGEAGVLFVAAAGNDSSNNDSLPHYPSNYDLPTLISVAAVDNQGQLASFSNFGTKSVQIAAPGVDIFSTINHGKYDFMSGTSMATPHVSGVAALLLSKDPLLKVDELKQRLFSTVKKYPSLRGKVLTKGVVNAFSALTNTPSPIDPDDPMNWEQKEMLLSSKHPYSSSANETYEVKIPGAKQMALYFTKIETERYFDKIMIYDINNKLVTEISGSYSEYYSPNIQGEYAKIVFTSDKSLEKYGFEMTKVGVLF